MLYNNNMICYKCLKELTGNNRYGLHPECFAQWFNLSDGEMEFSELIRKTSDRDSLRPELGSSLFQGKFKKYTARLSGDEYILKVCEKEYPELPQVEYLCNLAADRMGLSVADYFLINFYSSPAFVSKIFLPDYGVSNLIHMYHFLSAREEFSVENIVKIIEKETGKLHDVERFLELCLFDSLIGNHDRHGRNLALIEDRHGRTLAPFYDNPGYLGIEDASFLKAHHSPRGKIYTAESHEPTLADYKREIIGLGHDDVVERFIKRCHLPKILDIFSSPIISDLRRLAFKRLITERYEELLYG